jgi:hypothetical protein
MKTLVLIFGVITSKGQIQLIKVPDIALANINSCEKAIEKNLKWVNNPNFEQNSLPYGFYTYKNRVVMLQYCTENGVYSG